MSLQEKMTALANAIRAKTGGTGTLTLDEMTKAVSGFTGNGESLSEIESIEISGVTPSYGVSFSYGVDDEEFYIQLKSDVGDAAQRGIIDSDTGITMRAPIENFGDATAEDVTAGKTFTSTAGLKVTGTHECTGGGLTMKSGTATTSTIETGLSSISVMVLYKKSFTSEGLIQAVYNEGACNYIYCSNYGTVSTCLTGSSAVGSADGGTFTWSPTSNAVITEGDTYYWIAWGEQ